GASLRAAAGPAEVCEDAVPGDRCHAIVQWALDKAWLPEEHPDWFPRFDSSFPEELKFKHLQQILHSRSKGGCGKPCFLEADDEKEPDAGAETEKVETTARPTLEPMTNHKVEDMSLDTLSSYLNDKDMLDKYASHLQDAAVGEAQDAAVQMAKRRRARSPELRQSWRLELPRRLPRLRAPGARFGPGGGNHRGPSAEHAAGNRAVVTACQSPSSGAARRAGRCAPKRSSVLERSQGVPGRSGKGRGSGWILQDSQISEIPDTVFVRNIGRGPTNSEAACLQWPTPPWR
ncbi:unnamed protein product, partial [Prorocentrum cordatum]